VRQVAPRAIGAALLATAVVIGTVSDQLPAHVPQRIGEYWMLVGDFHVHAFPGDGSLTPWTLRSEAARAGLDVLAVTNHNQTATARLARRIAAVSSGPIVLAGQEVTNPPYHLIALGIVRAVSADQRAVDAIEEVHEQGGVAVAAHPDRSFRGFDEAAMAQLDGTEAAHEADRDSERREFVEFYERARRLNPRVAPIGSSDFHLSPALAVCRTYLFAREWSAAGVLEAIRSGRTVAADDKGRLYGDAALVQLVESAEPWKRVDEHPAFRRVSVTLAWAGLVGMLLAGGAATGQHRKHLVKSG